MTSPNPVLSVYHQTPPGHSLVKQWAAFRIGAAERAWEM